MKSDRIPEPIEIEKPVYEMDTGEESHQRDTTSPLLRGSSVVRPVYLSSMHVPRMRTNVSAFIVQHHHTVVLAFAHAQMFV